MAAPLCQSCDNVGVGRALIYRYTVEGDNRIVMRVQNQSGHFNVLDFVQAAGLVIVLCSARELRVDLPRKLFVKVAPSLYFFQFFHVEVILCDHFLIDFPFCFRCWFPKYKVSLELVR